MSKSFNIAAVCLFAFFAPAAAYAGPVAYQNAWVRTAVAGADTVAYMHVRSDVPVTLIGVASPLATSAALHQMKTEDGVMKMREVDKLDLPAGVIANFEPGAQFHLMLFGIKRDLKDGEHVPVILTLRNAKGRKFNFKVDAEVRFVAPAHEKQGAQGAPHTMPMPDPSAMSAPAPGPADAAPAAPQK